MHEEILDSLKKNSNYISGEEISSRLNVSRAAIWKNIQELRKLGYEIVAVPHLGYRLLSCPDQLYPWDVKFDLPAKIIGQKVLHFETTHSTMDEAFRLGMQKEPEGTVIIAENQTKGRGRLGRSWVSPKGKGIYLSVILRPRLPPPQVSKITLMCAVAVAEAVQTVTGITPSIKWPNDLLVENKKLAGILTEMSAELDRVKFIVVGIGLNVNATASQLPPEAASLKSIAQKSFSRLELTREILVRLEKWYERFQRNEFPEIVQRWKELALTLGNRIRVSDPGGFIEGEAFDIDEDGGLLIRNDAGTIVKKMSGDVMVVR